jgi:hypothetical protein
LRWPALALCACSLAGAAFLTACGGDDDGPATSTPRATAPASNGAPASSASTQAGGTAAPTAAGTAGPTPTVDRTSPLLQMPVSRYSVTLEDMGRQFIANLPGTHEVTMGDYAKPPLFASASQGEAMLKEWKYLGGYEAKFDPEGRTEAVLNGGFYLTVESHLFADRDGAHKAYEFFVSKLQSSRSKPAKSGSRAEESSAWALVEGKVGTSSVNAAFYRFMFRRGNLVVIVQTWGAEPFMKIVYAEALSALIDDKALDKFPAPVPTPRGR